MKKTYQEMLKESMAEMANKENLSEFDTTKTVDVKGPMLDPILGYAGDGELPTYKDAASVLERYYFGEKRKESEISEMDYENDKGEAGGESMKNTEGPEGEEQAGTANANTASGGAKEKAKDIAKEGVETVAEKEMSTSDLKSKNMKDAEGPEDEEQAGTGNTYSDFKKRVVESIEEIVDLVENDDDDEDDEDEGEEKEDGKEKAFPGAAAPFKKGMKEQKEDEKEEEEEEEEDDDDDDEKEEMKEDAGVGAGPIPAMAAKAKNDNKEGDEDDEYDDGKGKGKGKGKAVKEADEIELDVDEDITEALENEIIEKIISEMEDDGKDLFEQEEDVIDPEEDEDEDEDEGLDVDKKMEEMVNRLTSEGDTMKHVEGPEGEEQAGTGGKEKVIPPRKDKSNEGTKEKGTKPMDKGELADA